MRAIGAMLHGLPLTPTGAISLLLRLTPGKEADYDMTEGLLLLREDLLNPVLHARGQAWGDCQHLASLVAIAIDPRLANDDQAELFGRLRHS